MKSISLFRAGKYHCPIKPLDKNGNWNFEDPVGTVKYVRARKANHNSNRYKYYKRLSHRKVRRFEGELPRKGGGSNKVFDYWWTVD